MGLKSYLRPELESYLRPELESYLRPDLESSLRPELESYLHPDKCIRVPLMLMLTCHFQLCTVYVSSEAT